MYEFLKKLKPTYCDNCNVDYDCDSKKYYCEADLINAYKQGRADEREMIVAWCKEQSRILKKQAEDFDDAECFGGYRSFNDVIRYLENV